MLNPPTIVIIALLYLCSCSPSPIMATSVRTAAGPSSAIRTFTHRRSPSTARLGRSMEGKGEVIAMMRGSVNCPVAVKNWLQATSITEGSLFRPVTKGGRVGNSRLTDKSVAGIIKTYTRRLGLNEADFNGHSLRSGFLTSAARRGASVFKVRDVSRHKSMDVLQSYIRDAELFSDHAGVGLL
jgi:integrase